MDRAQPARREVLLVAAVVVVTLLALASRYGPHRDELYFAVAGRHPAFGYPDQPPLTPLLAGLAQLVAPSNLVVLRLPSALAVGAVVVLVAHFAWSLGGGRAAQLLAAVTVGASAGVLALGHLLSTATLDMLAWTAVLVIVAQALLDDRPRLWLAAGLVAGVGLENKHTVAFLLLGLFVGVALGCDTRPVLRTPWPWLGGLLALALWLPNLVWQATHGWPQLTLAADIRDEYGGLGGRVALVLEALVILSPVIAVVWLVGLAALFRREAWRPARPVGVAFVVFLAVLLVTGGKGYYLLGLLPVLVAAGCVVVAERWAARRVAVTGVVLVATAAVAWPAVVPVVPASTLAGSFWLAMNDDQVDTVGWPGYVDQVRAVVDDLPADERRTAVAFTGNYGEAGALEWYDVGLPVYSGHNGFGAWGPPPQDAGPVVVVTEYPPDDDFEGCEREATLENAAGIDNEEVGAGVYVCDGPVDGWAAAWPRLEHLDA